MTVTFFSNFLLLHQTPFCEAMVRKIGKGFKFVATEKIPEERLAMGYEDLSKNTDYAINAYENELAFSEAMRLGRESDVVIIGSAPDVFIKDRLKQNKLTFRYCERYFKQGRWRILDPRVFVYRFKHDLVYRKKPLYMLCASAYTAPDCRFILSYPGKTYRWGYFPEVKKYDEEELMARKSHDKISILWVGRQIKWKHPEMAINLAEHLRYRGLQFHLTVIGDGPLRNYLRQIVECKNLSEVVTFHDFMSQNEIRKYMEKANIFLFTSDREEGWGAVLNEAMNSGCAVIANDEIGSVPFLIENGRNGLTYHKSFKQMCIAIDSIIDNHYETTKLGIQAYRTMNSVWNAEEATKRLLKLIESINSGENLNFQYGPISQA